MEGRRILLYVFSTTLATDGLGLGLRISKKKPLPVDESFGKKAV
jgi:hypothetical protein